MHSIFVFILVELQNYPSHIFSFTHEKSNHVISYHYNNNKKSAFGSKGSVKINFPQSKLEKQQKGNIVNKQSNIPLKFERC